MSRVVFLIASVSMLLLVGDALDASKETASYIPVTIADDGDVDPATTRIVERGENFWKISEELVETPPDVAPYWRDLIDVNIGRIKSGDPDLIYPGEVLLIPGTP